MNTTMFGLAIALVALMLGCENGPLDPITSSAPSVAGLSKAAPPVVRIPLGGTPREPYPNSGLEYDIAGFVDYSMVRLTGNGNLFSLQLTAQALLTPREDDQVTLNISSSSNHVVSVSEEGVAFLEVRYVFPERNDRLALFITFQITQGSVEVADMLLDFIE